MDKILSGVDFSAIVLEIKNSLPIVAPVVIGVLALKKAWDFIKSNIKHS